MQPLGIPLGMLAEGLVGAEREGSTEAVVMKAGDSAPVMAAVEGSAALEAVMGGKAAAPEEMVAPAAVEVEGAAAKGSRAAKAELEAVLES